MPFAAKLLHLASRHSGWTLNRIWSFLRSCLQVSRLPLKGCKDSPPLQAKCFRYRYHSGRPVSINVNKTRKHFSRNIHGVHMFPQCFPVSHKGTSFPVSVLLFSRCKLCLRYTAGNFNENPSMRASTHVIFASNSSKGQILRALSNWMGPFDNPKLQVHVWLKLNEQFSFPFSSG